MAWYVQLCTPLDMNSPVCAKLHSQIVEQSFFDWKALARYPHQPQFMVQIKSSAQCEANTVLPYSGLPYGGLPYGGLPYGGLRATSMLDLSYIYLYLPPLVCASRNLDLTSSSISWAPDL